MKICYGKCFKKVLCFLVGVCLLICCSACQSAANEIEPIQNTLKQGYSCYQDGTFGFSVEFPVKWICESEPYRYGSVEEEASPDSGVKIYIEKQKESFIRVYGQHGTITTNFVVQSNYIKKSLDEKRVLYTLETDDLFVAQLFFNDNNHVSATISMDLSVYKENEQDIINLLKSITTE